VGHHTAADIVTAAQDEAFTGVEIVACVLSQHGQRHDVGVSRASAVAPRGQQGSENLAGARFAVAGPDHHTARGAGQRYGTTVVLREELDQGLVRVPLHRANRLPRFSHLYLDTIVLILYLTGRY
jgi:hypothetical protein